MRNNFADLMLFGTLTFSSIPSTQMPSSSPHIDISSEKDDKEDVSAPANNLQNGPDSGWLVGTRRGDTGAGSWGEPGAWNQSRRNSWDPRNAEDNPFPNGALVDSSLNHVREDIRMAPLTWHGRSDHPAHLDHEESGTWAQLQLHACSVIELRLASVEKDLAACKLERTRRSQEADRLLDAYHCAVDERREVERVVEKLEETSQLLHDLRSIALAFFPPPT
ncbi:hypothetical protein BT96DRAFT_1003443 [Gymnopus androsaceus JB14]|uniref:Uncharacterized protein n=1 Tax=Gymnopus androsaceus JB14 TaxID=1447944 RepID=A0A6A4GVZ3_9AGAR|nr:hypothetical protein BT96DRAFT_1003443 [Gymnopus androsaceus JB14]